MNVQLLQHDGLAVDQRTREIEKLCNDVYKINELFVDMAMLVEEQGNTIDNIEANVTSTYNNTKDAVKQIETAKKYEKKVGNKTKIAFGLSGIIATILIVVGISKAVH